MPTIRYQRRLWIGFWDDSKVAVIAAIWDPNRRSILRVRRLGATVGNQLTRGRCILPLHPRQLGVFTVRTTSRMRTINIFDVIVSASSAAAGTFYSAIN